MYIYIHTYIHALPINMKVPGPPPTLGVKCRKGYMYVCVYVYIYIYICSVCISICIHIYIYIYTHAYRKPLDNILRGKLL